MKTIAFDTYVDTPFIEPSIIYHKIKFTKI